MKKSIYLFTNYKDYLKYRIANANPQRGAVANFALAAGCKSSYLSAALNSEIHLTPDHAYGICRFLKLTDAETDFMMLMLEYERSGTPALRRRLLEKMKAIKAEQDKISNRVNAEIVNLGNSESRYYSQWFWMAVHLLTSIPEFQESASKIAQKLELSEALVKFILDELVKMKYVEHKDGKWVYAPGNRHLSHNSPEVVLHHNNWRQRALMSAAIATTEAVHYTSVMTLSARDCEVLKSRILEWIEESRAIMEPSPSEEIVCLNIDYFKL